MTNWYARCACEPEIKQRFHTKCASQRPEPIPAS